MILDFPELLAPASTVRGRMAIVFSSEMDLNPDTVISVMPSSWFSLCFLLSFCFSLMTLPVSRYVKEYSFQLKSPRKIRDSPDYPVSTDIIGRTSPFFHGAIRIYPCQPQGDAPPPQTITMGTVRTVPIPRMSRGGDMAWGRGKNLALGWKFAIFCGNMDKMEAGCHVLVQCESSRRRSQK